MVQLLGENMVVPQKIKNIITIKSSNSLLGVYSKEVKAGSQRDLYTHFHGSIIHNSRNMEAIQVVWIHRKMNGEAKAAHAHAGVPLSLTEEGNCHGPHHGA